MPTTSSARPSLLLRTSTLIPATIVCLTIGWARHDEDGKRGDTLLRFLHAGRERTAVLVTPDGAAPAAGWPVVLLLHGAGGSGSQILQVDGWRAVALRERFVVVAPDGTPADESRRARFAGNMRTWNSGEGSGLSVAPRTAVAKGIADTDFLLALLDTVASSVIRIRSCRWVGATCRWPVVRSHSDPRSSRRPDGRR